jgi:hypothetical protein
MSATETPAAPAEAPKGPIVELIPLGQNLGRVVLTISNQGSLARFQQELQTLGQHFGRIQQLQQRVQIALTTVERDALTKVGEAEVKDFNEKDAVFAKVWGFNVPAVANRQSTFVNTALRLLAVVSEEEVAKARASKDFKEEQLVVRGDRRLLETAQIRGLDLVVQFDQFAKVLQARRDAVIQLTELLKRAEKDEDKARIQTQLDQTLELLQKGNKEMIESVGYSITHNYEVEVLESKYVILLTQEEVAPIEAAIRAQQQAAAAPAVAEAPKIEKKADKKN